MATTLSIAGTSAPDPSIFPKAITLENIAQQTTHKASELALIDRSPMFGMDPPDWRDDHQKAMDEWRQSSAEALDAAVLDPAAYTDERIPGGWTPEEWRKTRAVDDWMRLQQDGEEPPLDGHAREFHRALLAERHFGGKGADSDDALFAEITAAATLRRDERTLAKSIVTTAATDAALPTDKAPGFAAWLKEAQGKPGFDPDKVGDYAAAFVDLRRQMKEREEPIADVLRKSWQAFRTGIESGIPAAEIAQLSREDFSLLLESLRARAEALPDEEKETLLAGMRKDFLRAVEGGYREAGEASVGLMRQGGTVGLEDFFGSDQAVQARRERDANASRSFELRRNRAAEIRRIMHADYDPIDYTKGFKWLQMAPGVTVTSLTMAVPVVGMPFMSSMLLGYAQENAYLKAIDSGMDEDAAGRYSEIIGPAVAVPQIILEKAGYSIWARKLPLFDKVLTKLDDAIANRGLRMLTKTGAITGAETAIELAQDLTETGIQDLANALDSDLPDVDWGTELQGAWRSIPEIAGSMLFLSIFGAAGGLNREARIAAFASASDLELRAAGLNAEGIAGIRAATGPGSTNAAVTSAWQTRDPNSPEAKAAAEELAARERARREAANQLRASGDLPIIVAGADGFTVLDGRTEETVGTAPTMAAAWTMAQAHSDFLADLDADAVAYMKSMLEGADFIKQLDPEQETRLELGTVMDRALVEAERPEMAARFAKQVALKEQAAGGTGEISYTVNGWSESQIRDNLRQTVNRIFQGGSVLTEFHEFMHGRRRKLKAAGQLTRGEEIPFLRAIDTVLAGKRTKEGERLSLLPEGITDEAVTEEMIDEAISEVMEMEILRSRQGGRKRTMPSRPGVANVPSGFITRNLTALARLAPEATRKFSAFIEAVRAHFGQAMARALALKKAEREGKFDADSYDAFLAKMLGLDVQDDFNRLTDEQAANLTGDPRLTPEAFAATLQSDYDPDADDVPFSLRRITPEQFGQRLLDKIGEEELRVEQPKAKYEDKRQMLLDFAQSVVGPETGETAASAEELASEGSLRGRIGSAAIIRQRLARDLETDLQVRFIGETISSPEALAVKAQALRNPRFETFYLLAAKRRTNRHKGGAGYQILDAMAITSRVPASAAIFADGKGQQEGLAEHLAFLQAAKADSYFLLHNHPSGDPSPSKADLRVTLTHAQEMQQHGISLVDHIVINHKQFATIDAFGVVNGHAIADTALREAGVEFDPYAWPSRLIDKVNDLGREMWTPDQIAMVARDIENDRANPDHVLGFITTARGKVAATFTGKADDILAITKEQLQEYSLSQGATFLMLHAKAGSRSEAERLINQFHVMNRDNRLVDLVVSYIDEQGRDWYESGMERGIYSSTPVFYGGEEGVVGQRVQEAAFSLGRSTVTPTADTRAFPGAEGSPSVIGPAAFSLAPDYGIGHRPSDEGPRAFDLAENDMMPADVYDHPEWYSGMGKKIIAETMAQLRKVRGKPDAEVTIYRSGPAGEMNTGDWVSLSKEYARTHADAQDPEGYKVWQAKAKAADVRWAMDDLAEFGYFGAATEATDSGVAFSIRAWHGTPHKVDKFTTEKIGTGEGAQAYGWGLYFADAQQVADEYRRVLSNPTEKPLLDGKPYDGKDLDGMEWSGVRELAAHNGDAAAAIQAIEKKATDYSIPPDDPSVQRRIEAIRRFDGRIRNGRELGNLYRVTLKVEDEDLLDWDKPLSEQSEKVKAFFRDTGINVGTIDQAGWELYEMAARRAYQNRDGERLDPWDNPFHAMGDNGKAASELLQAAGIRGIRYLDGNSRNRPFKDIKRDFLNALPENAEFDDVQDAIGNGAFSPDQVAFLNALKTDDWLGFDYPAQAISAALSDNINNWDPSPALVDSIKPLRGEVSYNYVIFDEAAIKITEENGTPVNLTQESGSFSLGRAPEVWKGFPAVQWLVNTNQLTTKGGELIAVPEYKWKVNKDWYLAKGKGDVSAEERAKAGWQLLHRLFTAAGAERLQAVREFLKSHPDAVLLPIRGLEAPNKHANIIPEIYARLLHASGGNRINDTVHKINTTHNTGKSAAERLQQIHEYEGDIEAGVDYLIVDDVSTTGATAYYLARYIASKGGNVAGIMQLGLTPRGKAEKFKPKPYVGDEHVLEMTPATRKALQAKGDDATINNVVQTLGIAYDWRTLTDALARALTANWSAVRRSVGTMSAGGRSNPAGSDGRGFAAAGSGGNAARGLPAFPGEIEAAGQQGPQQTTLGFSLAPSRSLDLMRMNALDRVRNPRRRAEIFQRISREFERLKLEAERFELIAGTKRLRKSLAKEAAMREAKAREDFENDVYARHWELLSDEDLVKIKSQPLHAYLADPASPLRGRLMSRSAAMKHRAELFGADYKGGEWDGSDGLSRSLFGGSLTPDQAAQELYDAGLIADPYVDTMWEKLHSEQAQVSAMKERLAQVQQELRAARTAAKEEANAWLRHAQGNQDVNYSPKQEILRALASMQAILRALPPPVRARIGGIMEIARAGSEEARLKILKETIAKADQELDRWMRATLDREFRALLDKTRPERDEAGKRPKGKIGANVHDLFRSIEAAMFFDADETEAEATRLETLAEAERTTPEQAAHLTMEANLVRLVGNWSKADAARREMALAEASSAYAGGYLQAQIKAAQKRERITRRRADLKQDTGKAGDRMERVQAELQNRGTKLGRTKEALLAIFSFDQMLGLVFGERSDTARTFAEWELRAANAKEDAIQRTHNAVEELLNDLAGNPLAGEKLRWKLSTERSVEWTDWKGRKQTATEMEALSYTLWWAQEDGKRHMEGLITENPDGSTTVESDWHWREEDVASIERQLSKEAKAIRLHLRENYGAEYDRINAVFSDLYGVNMPRHKDYSPISVAPSHAPGGQMADPVSGAMQGPGLTPGSLKNRSHSAVAEPQRMDALQHYVAHVKQMEHFIAYAQLSSELMAIVNHRELGNSIEAKAGKEALNILRAWTDYFAQGGTRDAAAHLAVSGWFQRGLDRISQMALVGRASVLAIQSVQLGAAAYQMPVASYLKRLAKLTTGQLGWGKAIRSDYIQRRLAQMPPAVQQAMQGLASGKPNALKYSTAKLGRLISGADALFTAGTYAIIQDYQLKLAKERGMPNPEQWAEQEAIRLTDQVAQPMRAGARSLIEVTATGPAFRMMWAFASEPRQKLALSAYGLMQKKGIDRFKGFAVTWTVSGMLAAVVRAAVRDLRDDGEDDEVFDERNWDPTKLALMALSGPFGGLPIVGKEIEASIYAGAGEYLPGGTLISGPSKAVGTGKKLVSGGAEWETAIKDAETIFAGIGVADPTAAALTSWLHIARDLEALYRNLTED